MNEGELRKHIGNSIKAKRKTAGFRSAKSFADHVGIPPSAYTEYEQGRRNLSFERAWQIADALGCTLDELGGRDFSPPGDAALFADPYQAELHECYEASTPEGRSVILGTARGQRELSLKASERGEPQAEGVVNEAV